jgi:hypothetical protein
MHRLLAICGPLSFLAVTIGAAGAQPADSLRATVDAHQSDLAGEGLQFLLRQVRQASFLLIGGLHGDNETQSLLQALTPGLGDGAKLFVTEMSPWAASRLAAAMPEASGVSLRGADIEEAQLARLIRDLATSNPDNSHLQEMVSLTAKDYKRTDAPRLVDLARDAGPLNGGSPGGIPLATLVLRTLEVEADRARPETAALQASLRRERVMKDFFLAHYREAGQKLKVAVVFGRNHLHRGVDRRGVATLGNFITEFAVAEGANSFNVAIFAAGGQIALSGLRDFDERKDDPALDYLAGAAQHRTTVFDMTALREPLRRIPVASRTPAQASLLYWADSYDAMICYREVTPSKLR